MKGFNRIEGKKRCRWDRERVYVVEKGLRRVREESKSGLSYMCTVIVVDCHTNDTEREGERVCV